LKNESRFFWAQTALFFLSLRENKGKTLTQAAKYSVERKIQVLFFANFKFELWVNG